MRKWLSSVVLLLLISALLPGTLLSGTARAADTIVWGPKQSAVYDEMHPYTLNWSGNPLDRGGLNLLDTEYTTKSAEADIVINQYGDIGASAILELDDEDLTDLTDANLSGFTSSFEIEQGAVYLVVLHDGTHAKIQIDRILPDNGFSITKVMFSYVLEQPAEEEPTLPDAGGLDLGSPSQDMRNPAATYEFEENGSITVPWTKLSGHATWDIYRSDNGASYIKMTDFKLTKPEFVDNYTFAGHIYLYKVVSYDKNGGIVSISTPIKVVITEKASDSEIVLQIDNYTAWINGTEHTLEVAPFIYNGRTLIPLRFISEALGAEVEWDGETRSITLTRGDDVIVLVIDESEAEVNGKSIMMDVPAMIHQNKTMVPLRFVSEQFDQEITFEDETRKIIIVGGSSAPTGDSNNEDSEGEGSNGSDPSYSGDEDYFIGSWKMWVPAGQYGASGGILQIHDDGTISYDWNGPQTGTWEYDEETGKLLLTNYKSGWDWTVTETEDGITVSTFGVYETGTRID